jgi:hypothetical protein
MRRILTSIHRGASTWAAVLAFGLAAVAAPPALKTPAEACRFQDYSQNEAIGRFLSEAQALAKELRVDVVGRTKDVEGYPAHDIFLAVLTEDGDAEPGALDRTKPTVLVIASQHGNEQSAKEAALRLIRDLALGDMKGLLKKINVLVIPQANPYGNQFDIRRNETGLDMNRDHVKLEAAGVEAIHRVFRAWMPEVTIDVHEKGDDYYRVSIGCVSNLNISRLIESYSRRTILAEVGEALGRRSVTFHEYLVTEEMGSTGAAGVETPSQKGGRRQEYTRFSTTDLNDGRNSLGIYETFSFIQEGASRHDLETLEARTGWQYEGLRAFLESAAGHGVEIVKIIRDLRSTLLEAGPAGEGPANPVCLRSEYARDPADPTLTIEAYEPARSPIRGILRVDKRAGDVLTAQDVAPYRQPPDLKVVTRVIENWFPNVNPTASQPRSLGYLIPAGHFAVVETLLRHGIEVEMFVRDQVVEAEALEVQEVAQAAQDYLAPDKIVVEKKAAAPVARRGDFYVPCAGEAANLIPCLLEPESEYGFIRYQKFQLVPEAGNMYAFFRIVKPQSLPLVPYKRFGAGPQKAAERP